MRNSFTEGAYLYFCSKVGRLFKGGALSHVDTVQYCQSLLSTFHFRNIYRSPFLDKHWHHVCVTWTNNGGELKVYTDGSLIKAKTECRSGDVIHGGGVLVIGQDQDKVGGDFVAAQSLVGLMSHLNLWNFVLRSFALADMAEGFGTEKGNTVAWKDIVRSQMYGQVEVVPISDDPPKRKYSAHCPCATLFKVCMTRILFLVLC